MRSEPNRIANRNAAIRWGGFVIGLLSLQVLIGVFAVMLATGDPSAAVVPDYYQKALHWDEKVKAEAESAKLGYKLLLTSVKSDPGVSLQAQLLNQNQRPVQIQSGTIRLFHHARGSDVTEALIDPTESGSVFLANSFSVDGLWQVEFDAKDQHGNRFVDSQVVMVDQTGETLPTLGELRK